MRPFAHDFMSEALQKLAACGPNENGATRPVLLRVLTDLFVMRQSHTDDEIRQFAEIASRVVDDASPDEILHVAGALWDNPDAPVEVVDRLVARGGPGALLLLAKCRHVSTLSIDSAASLGLPAAAAAVAQRADLDATMVKTLAMRGEPEVLRALAANEAAPLGADALNVLVDHGREDSGVAALLCQRLPHRPEVAGLFLSATSRQRAMMLASAKRAAGDEAPVTGWADASQTPAARRIEAAALDRDSDALHAALAEACDCDPALMSAIIADPGGEPLAIALRAVGMSPVVATRIFLFADPEISHSFGKVSMLTRLAASTSQEVAGQILRAMIGTPARAARGQHVPVLDPSARPVPGRTAASARVTELRRSTQDTLKRIQAR
ncbi:MAG: hypothetical protein JWM36_3710 [Hyphomicrobiales bacterium]|nr:hypothetical protein [Hyphomicrobiales bacterium]